MEELKIKKDRVVEAAAKCPTANATLRALFPEAFEPEKPEPFKFGEKHELTPLFNDTPLAIGTIFPPSHMREKCLIVHRDWNMVATDKDGYTLLTFYPKTK